MAPNPAMLNISAARAAGRPLSRPQSPLTPPRPGGMGRGGLPPRYAGMDPRVAQERFAQFKAGQLPGQQPGGGPTPTPIGAAQLGSPVGSTPPSGPGMMPIGPGGAGSAMTPPPSGMQAPPGMASGFGSGSLESMKNAGVMGMGRYEPGPMGQDLPPGVGAPAPSPGMEGMDGGGPAGGGYPSAGPEGMQSLSELFTKFGRGPQAVGGIRRGPSLPSMPGGASPYANL